MKSDTKKYVIKLIGYYVAGVLLIVLLPLYLGLKNENLIKIPDLINLILIYTLIFVTAFYAYETRKMAEFTRRNQDWIFHREICQEILIPIRDELERIKKSNHFNTFEGYEDDPAYLYYDQYKPNIKYLSIKMNQNVLKMIDEFSNSLKEYKNQKTEVYNLIRDLMIEKIQEITKQKMNLQSGEGRGVALDCVGNLLIHVRGHMPPERKLFDIVLNKLDLRDFLEKNKDHEIKFVVPKIATGGHVAREEINKEIFLSIYDSIMEKLKKNLEYLTIIKMQDEMPKKIENLDKKIFEYINTKIE